MSENEPSERPKSSIMPKFRNTKAQKVPIITKKPHISPTNNAELPIEFKNAKIYQTITQSIIKLVITSYSLFTFTDIMPKLFTAKKEAEA